MRYADLGPAIRPRAARLPPNWFPRSGRLGSGRTRRLTCITPNSPRQGKLRDADPSERLGLDGAPVGAVLAALGKHVREHPEAEAVEEQAEDGGDPVCHPAAVGAVHEAGERAEQDVVGIGHGLAEPAVDALAIRLPVRGGSDRSRIGQAAELGTQGVLLGLGATAELVGREIGEAEQHEPGTDNGDQADEGAHRGYYRPPGPEPDLFMRI